MHSMRPAAAAMPHLVGAGQEGKDGGEIIVAAAAAAGGLPRQSALAAGAACVRTRAPWAAERTAATAAAATHMSCATDSSVVPSAYAVRLVAASPEKLLSQVSSAWLAMATCVRWLALQQPRSGVGGCCGGRGRGCFADVATNGSILRGPPFPVVIAKRRARQWCMACRAWHRSS